MRIFYIKDMESTLTDKEIEKGIVTFETSSHFADVRNPKLMKRHRLPDSFDIRGRLGNIRPVSWTRNRMSHFEPTYILNAKYLFPPRKLKGNELHFDDEKKYDVPSDMQKHLIDLEMDKKLTKTSPFIFSKKLLLAIGIGIALVVGIVLLNQFHVIHLW